MRRARKLAILAARHLRARRHLGFGAPGAQRAAEGRDKSQREKTSGNATDSHRYDSTPVARYDVSPWLDAAENRAPDGSTIDRALAAFDPSFARLPSTVIRSPTFIDFRVQPLPDRPFGLPISIFQVA